MRCDVSLTLHTVFHLAALQRLAKGKTHVIITAFGSVWPGSKPNLVSLLPVLWGLMTLRQPQMGASDE
jgi:hypothetical protein